MGTILRIRKAYIAIRKLAILVLKRPFFTKSFMAFLRRFTALWSKFWLTWISSPPSRVSKSPTVNFHTSELQEEPVQIGTLVRRDNSKKTFLLGQSQTVSIQTTSPTYRPVQNAEAINLDGLPCSLYPLSQGFHGNSWTTLSQNSHAPALAHDIPNITDEPSISFSQEHTTTLSLQSMTHSDCSVQEDSRTEISRTLHSPCHLCHTHIKPVMPEDIDRYDVEKRKYSPSTTFDATIELSVIPLNRPTPSQGWQEYVHPEGGRYFYHKEKRAYTDADIYNPRILGQAMDDISIIMDFVTKNYIPLLNDCDLVIDISNDNQTNYYFANHEKRSIFFLDTYEINDASIDSHGRLLHHIEVQYWYHVNLYPHSLSLSASLAGELKDIVLHFVGDSMTSSSSTAPYDLDDLYKILDITTNLEARVDKNAVGSITFISRFMLIFASSRYWNYAGEAHARLDREQSVHGTLSNQSTWFTKVISLLLFLVPNAHLQKLRSMWVDEIAYSFCWDQMFKQLSSEWKAEILLAAILLNANVGFLAVQGEDRHRDFLKSPAQICSYMSMATNIGSIIMGLLLVTQTSKERPVRGGQEVQNYLSKRVHRSMGLEILAILYSLPYAFLIWGLLYFLAAFCFDCFQNSDSSARIVVGSLCSPIVLLSWWSYTSWGKLLQKREEHNTSDKSSDTKVSSSNKIIGPRWILPVNLWIIQAFSKLRNQSHDAEKTTAV